MLRRHFAVRTLDLVLQYPCRYEQPSIFVALGCSKPLTSRCMCSDACIWARVWLVLGSNLAARLYLGSNLAGAPFDFDPCLSVAFTTSASRECSRAVGCCSSLPSSRLEQYPVASVGRHLKDGDEAGCDIYRDTQPNGKALARPVSHLY